MVQHKTATREEWLAGRNQLLAAEKELTRRGDLLAAQRRDLPWVPVDTARGLEFMMGYYGFLDRAPLGRNEGDVSWFRRHDEYASH